MRPQLQSIFIYFRNTANGLLLVLFAIQRYTRTKTRSTLTFKNLALVFTDEPARSARIPRSCSGVT